MNRLEDADNDSDTSLCVWVRGFCPTHHGADSDGDAPAAVGVRHYVSVADGEEGDGDHPQGVQNVGVVVVVVSETKAEFK